MRTVAMRASRFGRGAFGRGALRQVLSRPDLWTTALAQARRVARPGWWRHPPFLPVPDPGYLAFRLETQYGADAFDPRDVVVYLEWCRDQTRALRHRRRGPRR